MKKCWGEARRDSQTAALECSPGRPGPMCGARLHRSRQSGSQAASTAQHPPRFPPGCFREPFAVISTCTIQHGNGQGGQFCAAGFSVVSFVQLWSKTQALRVTMQYESILSQLQSSAFPCASGADVGWGHRGAFRAVCHPWGLRSRGGSCSPASASRNRRAANQKPLQQNVLGSHMASRRL